MIENLYRIIDDQKITLIEDDLSQLDPLLKGLYFDNIILLHKNIDTSAERTCVIAEEVGHYFTTVGDILDKTELHKAKEEEKARRWATNELIDPTMFIDAFKAGVSNRWELSHFLGLTEEFIEEALVYFKKLYGERITISEYTIHFDPLWIFKSFEEGIDERKI